jgi:uncharacterized membrane protein YdbT with pleckstrin-like domain
MTDLSHPTPSPGAVATEDVLYDGYPAMVPSLGILLLAIITLGIALPFLWFRARGRHYRVTTQRVVIEAGVFSKKMEQVDLYRITDYVVERPFGQRLLGTGNVVLEAIDSTTPVVRLDGLRTDVVQLYEKLRAATEAAKQRRGVRVLDYGEPSVPITG